MGPKKINFTLVELIVVIAIMGLCSSIGAYYFFSKKQETSIVSSDINFISAKKVMIYIRKTFLNAEKIQKYSKNSITFWDNKNKQKTLYLDGNSLKETDFKGIDEKIIAKNINEFIIMPIGLMGRQTIKFLVSAGKTNSVFIETAICIRNDLHFGRHKK